MKEHHYKTTVNWVGNLGTGTSNYRAYSRNHDIIAEGKPTIPASSDPFFRGDPDRYNPEELLLASLSSCHMLWYLHLCSVNSVTVVEVTLRPEVMVTDAAMIAKANSLHHEANKLCFIANSVNFPVHHQPDSKVKE
jgi:organic hydroperoxide reductase OsmC/OhrA